MYIKVPLSADSKRYYKNLHAEFTFGLRILTFASAAFIASVFNCGFNAARTALAQMAEKRM